MGMDGWNGWIGGVTDFSRYWYAIATQKWDKVKNLQDDEGVKVLRRCR